MIRRIIVTSLLLILCAPWGAAHAGTDYAEELKHARKALSEGDYAKAYTAYRKVAEGGENPLADFTVGLFHRNGWGMAENPQEACRWFERAARGAVPTGAHYYAECLLEGTGGAPDPEGAAAWFGKASSYGHHGSLVSLAELTMEGRGVPKNPEKALEICGRALEHGVVRAQVVMGRFRLHGAPSIRDNAEARAWFGAAADRGIAEADYYLGVMARDGLGRAPSPAEAREWFERAASKGYVPAYLPVGSLYLGAPEVKKNSARDLAKAYLWLSAAVRTPMKGNDLKRAEKQLAAVLAIMPETWMPELDAKVDAHLAAHAMAH